MPTVSIVRNLGVIAATAAIMVVTDYVVLHLLLLTMFWGPVILIGIPIALVALPIAIIGVSKHLTGGSHTMGAITVSIVLAVAGVYGYQSGALSLFGDINPTAHLLLCVLSAVTLGLFLGPWPLRGAGVAAAATLVALVLVLPTSGERAAVEHARAEAETQRQNAEARQQVTEHFLDQRAFPVLAESPGWRNPKIRATGWDAMTWMVNDVGAVATALVLAPVEESEDTTLCAYIGRPGDGAPADWCIRTGAVWTRADGTGVAYIDGGRAVAIKAADEFTVAQAGGSSSATAADIAALATSVRAMTDAEVETYILPVYDGVNTPVIDAPDL
ncbi:hypothetical protein CTE05_16870 [Cellulomonas terrae]|uniref:Uncharacterized protein n=1 Tax=Cellulomonas terrae TaxID=311234 RepID=A0A511JJE8_9CELL|nr:hypothetical protein CTE05_16870 [Cellulomonas terrae]